MTIGDRFKSWIENTTAAWKDKLRGWLLRSIAEGVTKLFTSEEKSTIAATQETLTKIRNNPSTPLEIKNLIDKTLVEGNWFNVGVGMVMCLAGILFSLFGLGKPVGRSMEYTQDKLIQSSRLDPQSVITAWRRDPAAVKWFDDLRDLGWSEERINLLKQITLAVPTASDVVRFAVREVYNPELRAKYQQDADLPAAAQVDAEIAGLKWDTFKNYWAAHWMLPSSSEGFEMLHRGILSSEDELKDLLKALDVMPYWRDQLIKLSWNIPTRVDVRRFWDMRTIDEARLREIYAGLGYHGRDLDDYVLWTKIYTDFPDLLARYKNGWITIEDVRRDLIAMGMTPARADTLIQEKIKKAAPERVAAEKNLTKAEIIKGVKLEVITRAEGIELLQDMGYGIDEARYIMTINLEAAAGSPHSFAEFKDITQQWRLAAGLEGKPMTEEIKKLGAEVVRLSAEVSALERTIKEEQGKLLPDMEIPVAATARVKEIQATLYKAQSELIRVKTDYNAKVAEWRHAPK